MAFISHRGTVGTITLHVRIPRSTNQAHVPDPQHLRCFNAQFNNLVVSKCSSNGPLSEPPQMHIWLYGLNALTHDKPLKYR